MALPPYTVVPSGTTVIVFVITGWVQVHQHFCVHYHIVVIFMSHLKKIHDFVNKVLDIVLPKNCLSVGSAASFSVWQHVKLSEKIRL